MRRTDDRLPRGEPRSGESMSSSSSSNSVSSVSVASERGRGARVRWLNKAEEVFWNISIVRTDAGSVRSETAFYRTDGGLVRRSANRAVIFIGSAGHPIVTSTYHDDERLATLGRGEHGSRRKRMSVVDDNLGSDRMRVPETVAGRETRG